MGLRTALSVRYAQVVRLHSITLFKGPIGFNTKFLLVLSRLNKTGLWSQKMNLTDTLNSPHYIYLKHMDKK